VRVYFGQTLEADFRDSMSKRDSVAGVCETILPVENAYSGEIFVS
jgi:hypothetical protein